MGQTWVRHGSDHSRLYTDAAKSLETKDFFTHCVKAFRPRDLEQRTEDHEPNDQVTTV